MQSEVALPAGFALNEYRIEATLGVGGFGLTYLAVDSNLDLKVAIKEYLPNDIALRNADNSVSVKSRRAMRRWSNTMPRATRGRGVTCIHWARCFTGW
jgi:serine/threonine protein kinase